MEIDGEAAALRGGESGASAPRDARYSTLLVTMIGSIDRRTWTRALVRNLSKSGMKVDCDHNLSAGMPVVCELRGIGEVPATIHRIERRTVGVKFDAAIDPNLVWQAAAKPSDTPAPAVQDG